MINLLFLLYKQFIYNIISNKEPIFRSIFVIQAHTTDGAIDFHEWLGDSWGVLFSHPAPFNPICTTEMGSMARHYKVI